MEARKKLKFEDLEFFSDRGGSRRRCILYLDSEVTVSIIGGEGAYGNGESTFEMAAWKSNKFAEGFITLGEYDDVLGWLSKDELMEEIEKLQDYTEEKEEEYDDESQF
jgi:hypothetical protein